MGTPPGPPSPRVDEDLVARLWDAQHPLALPLRTVDGEEVRVVYRGRRRFDRGPDFPGALISMPGERLLSGDLEIHLRTSDWRRHGHHRDPVYNNVVIQIVLWHDTTELCYRQDGAAVPVVELAPRLLLPLETLLLANSLAIPRPSPCLPDGAGLPALVAHLEDCGMDRLEAKARRFAGELACMPVEEVLYRGIADILGYSQNRGPFRRLVDLLPLSTLLLYRDSGGTGIEALFFGAAGLLPGQRRSLPADRYSEEAAEVWERDGGRWAGCAMGAGEWQFFRVRPANFPTRRVAGLAAAVSGWPAEGLSTALTRIITSTEPRKTARALEALVPGSGKVGYWTEHSDFGQLLQKPCGLVGRNRAAEAVINVFLPTLLSQADATGDEEMGRRVREAYRQYPKRGDNEFTRYMAEQITGMRRPVAARSACRQQGLLHIFRTWCEVKRCCECPVARLRDHPSV